MIHPRKQTPNTSPIIWSSQIPSPTDLSYKRLSDENSPGLNITYNLVQLLKNNMTQPHSISERNVNISPSNKVSPPLLSSLFQSISPIKDLPSSTPSSLHQFIKKPKRQTITPFQLLRLSTQLNTINLTPSLNSSFTPPSLK